MQCRNAVCLAIQHVQFVGELMNDDVVAITGHLHVTPGNDQRTALPGFTGKDIGKFMDDATVIFNLPWHHEFIGIHHDAHPFTIGRKPKIQDGQATLGGNRNADFIGQLQPAAGAEFLFGKELFDQ